MKSRVHVVMEIDLAAVLKEGKDKWTNASNLAPDLLKSNSSSPDAEMKSLRLPSTSKRELLGTARHGSESESCALFFERLARPTLQASSVTTTLTTWARH